PATHTLSLHDALPIYEKDEQDEQDDRRPPLDPDSPAPARDVYGRERQDGHGRHPLRREPSRGPFELERGKQVSGRGDRGHPGARSEEHTSELQSRRDL